MYLYLIPFKVNLVFNPEVNLGSAHEQFDDNGRLKDAATLDALTKLMDALKASI